MLVHNQFLEVWVELGLIGLMLFLILLAAIVASLRHSAAAFGYPSEIDTLTVMFVGFLPGVLFLSVPNNKSFWMIVGLTATLAGLARQRSRSRAVPEPASLDSSSTAQRRQQVREE